ncbi:carboxymuconolactone decarboxylase family protein [Actinomadura macra]|uniref:carboxymuconolactone decarboxylase family protein n=1 Tax=Actinomadura macra TaxID=46164 RepID=UPI00082EA365|nr:carboxymuconolactone decarboxylase family protein [Actinomadura macra]
MHLPILTPQTAPPASRPILDTIAADLGFVPNLAATIAASPTLLAGFDGLRRAVNDASFDPVHREIAGLAVGVAVDNAYGVAFHSTVLAQLGLDDKDIEAMRRGAEPGDRLQAAVYAFAAALATDRGAVSDTIVQRTLDAGLEPADLLQLVTECAFASLVGLIDNLAGRVELDQPLRPQAWK